MMILWLLNQRSSPKIYLVGVQPSLLLKLFMQYYSSMHLFIIILSTKLTGLVIMKNGVPKYRRFRVNPIRGKTEFLVNKTIKVNPNGGKQGEIPNKESPGIANNKSDPNGCQTELVPMRPRVNSNKDPSGINSMVPEKSKRNPRRESPFEFHAQVWSERAPKGNKFLSACRNFLCRVQFLRRSESEQKGNHSKASAREFCASKISWRTI